MEKALKSVVKKKKTNRIGSREQKSVRENVKTLRKHFQKRKFKEGEERRKKKDAGSSNGSIGSKGLRKGVDYSWSKDDMLAK